MASNFTVMQGYYLRSEGGTLTGDLTLDNASVIRSAEGQDLRLQPAPNQAVAIGDWTLDGPNYNISNNTSPWTIQSLGQLTLKTSANGNIALNVHGTGYVDVMSKRIRNVADPVSAQDVATKTYVDRYTTGTLALIDGGAGTAFRGESTITLDSGGTSVFTLHEQTFGDWVRAWGAITYVKLTNTNQTAWIKCDGLTAAVVSNFVGLGVHVSNEASDSTEGYGAANPVSIRPIADGDASMRRLVFGITASGHFASGTLHFTLHYKHA